MLTLPLIIAFIFLLIFIFADILNPLFSTGLLFFFYFWAYIVFDLSMAQKVFYLIAIVFYLAVRANLQDKLQTNASAADINGSKPGGILKGSRYQIFTIGVGIVMLLIMFAISAQKGQILGVAELSISNQGFSATVTKLFAPTISMAIGFIENRLFISLLIMLFLMREPLTQLLGRVPVLNMLTALGFLLPVLLTCITFGLFHVIAYYLQWSLMIWAMCIMAMWIGSYYITGKDASSMDVAHGCWNAYVTGLSLISVAG